MGMLELKTVKNPYIERLKKATIFWAMGFPVNLISIETQ